MVQCVEQNREMQDFTELDCCQTVTASFTPFPILCPMNTLPRSAFRRRLLGLLSLTALGMATSARATTPAQGAKPSSRLKVVYHLNDPEQASDALRNIRNHLKDRPDSDIHVVTHGGGINFLLKDAKDSFEEPFAPQLDALHEMGVSFFVCNNTLLGRKIAADKLISAAKIVPSGALEVVRLQCDEGFAYFKP